MAKRKRDEVAKAPQQAQPSKIAKSTKLKEPSSSEQTDIAAITLQIVTGSYERILHGFTASVPSTCYSDGLKKSSDDVSPVQFVDTFLFEAHASAIKCLALSPLPKADSTEPPKVILASGGTDERINLYSLSAAPPTVSEHYPTVPTLAGNKILENPKNKELGALLHHSAPITALSFPSRSKLLAAAEDNTVSVSRTRDLTVVSTIKAPHPKVQGRPSGDTAPPGGSPSGINGFAVHPSMKLMLSVGKGERCMRLWNLVTGKKAGVLNFDREILQSVKEGRWSTGEGRKIVWNAAGEEFAVAFEWGAVLFGIDSTPICRVFPGPRSKLHEIQYISVGDNELFAISTEDGRVIFYSARNVRKADEGDDSSIPYAEPVAQLGGKSQGYPGRVKSFEMLSLKGQSGINDDDFAVVTANSEGVVRVWQLLGTQLRNAIAKKSSDTKDIQVGKLLSSYETGNRITCLKAFVMMPTEEPNPEDLESSDGESEDVSSSEESDA
ncbi:putative 60S ribosome biogenesis protein Mak11, partial [Aspergillus foveolatus]|uniref:putative 60S ribosome biogenesis protein Mak11 n=1 Tax=Aspergillus foveolatus TaxID=210207 RepID=UPI003CCD12CE